MTEQQWSAFTEFREGYRQLCNEWNKLAPKLLPLQKTLAGTDYNVETSIVFNRAYDEFTKDDEINLIVIGDNPGKDEQLAKNNRYFVGKSGIVAENFFRKNTQLNMDFRKKTIIMNKTPVHTAKTKQLKDLEKNGGTEIKDLIEQSQLKCAEITARLHMGLGEECQLWLVGHSELKKGGVFLKYKDRLKESYGTSNMWEKVFLFNHFSMGRFSVDLKESREENPQLPLDEVLYQIGTRHKNEVYGER
ncbi:MAG: hypothetical protein KBS64_06685 [Treponema sp.]|nr:hypothetical protein [Candidatus Treponema equi]